MSNFKLPSGNGLLFIGFLLTLLGLGAILAPSIAGDAVVYLIGSLLLATGLFQLVVGWREEGTATRLINMIQGIIVGLAGIAVLAHPYYGMAALTLVLTIFFVLSGIHRMITSFAYRPAQGWLAVLFSGLVSVLLGWLIWKQWPLSGMWAIGILVGIDLLTRGIALITLALTWKNLVNKVSDIAAHRKAD
jgi:uncharacterized membrane protein HdeD (DUF308 family)